ncbi:MAG: 50S ribosomal protein L22 [candidate division Zixibacteria bacterium]|nr:50S ribosomal protein L22 [candidate division Zixibacteria bacterium]
MSVRSHLEISRAMLVPTVKGLNGDGKKKLIKTAARQVKITSDFVGHTLDIFNGSRYVRVRVTEEMVGRRLADVAKRDSATAKLRFVSIPPRKMRLVAEMVKGMKVQQALDVLNFTPRIAARHLAKTVKAAAANILSEQGTDHINAEDLYVANVTVDSAPTQKRIRFQSMGRVFRIRKRFCHVSVWVAEHEDAVKAREAAAEAERAKGKAKVAAPKAKRPTRKTAGKATKKTAAAKTAKKKTTKSTAARTGAKSAAKSKSTEPSIDTQESKE